MFAVYNRLGLHVSATPREVIKAARATIGKAQRRDPAQRINRKDFYRRILRQHESAQSLYCYAMGSIK